MAERKKGSAAKLRALEGQVHQFDVPGDMTGLLQRIRANKSKRSASVLVKTGPIRVSVLALDEGGQLEDQSVDGPFTMQYLLGREFQSMGGTTGSARVTCWSWRPASRTGSARRKRACCSLPLLRRQVEEHEGTTH